MAFEEALESISVPADVDLSAKQYCFMKINSSGNLVAAGDGEAIAGVLQDKPSAAGRVGCLGVRGVTKVLLGGTVAAGDRVTSNSDGAAVTESTGDNLTHGICLVGGASGEIGTILLQPLTQSV